MDQDTAEAKARREEVEEQERLRQEEIQQEKDEQHKEEEKKNTIKYVPIPDKDVPTHPPVIATRRLEKGEYVPLWYYTNAGLEDTTNLSISLMKKPYLLSGTKTALPHQSPHSHPRNPKQLYVRIREMVWCELQHIM